MVNAVSPVVDSVDKNALDCWVVATAGVARGAGLDSCPGAETSTG